MYLRKMSDRFDENRVLATAAYNAGPLKVESWLPDADQLDARIWIENIPYNETRSYVRRVLTADAIFNWRLTGEVRQDLHDTDCAGAGPDIAHEQALAACNAIGPAIVNPGVL